MDKLARNMRLRRYARLLATCKNAQLVESIDLLLTALTVKLQHRTAAATQGAPCGRATPAMSRDDVRAARQSQTGVQSARVHRLRRPPTSWRIHKKLGRVSTPAMAKTRHREKDRAAKTCALTYVTIGRKVWYLVSDGRPRHR
jgi:hypothetical protein